MTSDIQISPLSKSQEEIADLHARFSEELQNILRTRGLSEEDKHNITSIAEVINRVATGQIKTADQYQELKSRRNKEAIDQLQYAIEILLPLKEKEFHLAHEQLQQLQEIAEVFDITLSQKNPAKANLRKKANLKRTHPQFVGREVILRKIQAHLSAASSKPIVLYGPPGIGKSEMAIAYANTQLDKYSVIWTIAAETKETREESYKALAEALNLPILEEDTYEDIKKRVHSKLEQFEEIRWLLIYDNLEESVGFPERGGDTIITSRSYEPFVLFESIELTLLSESESVSLLKQITGEEESEEMHKLAKHFGYYPFILGQIANYIRLNAGITIASYLETTPAFDERKLTPNERYKVTLQSTFDVIKETLPPLAFKWLQVCAFLHADCISKDFLKLWLKRRGEVDSLTTQRILTVLINRGLLRFDSEKQIFSIPRLFQEILRSDEGFIETADLLLSVGKSFEFDTIADWEATKNEANHWVLHTNQLMNNTGLKSLLKKESQSLLKLIVGICQTRNGRYRHAHVNLLEALELHIEKPDSVIKADILNALGVCLWYQRNFQKSLQKHRAAFKIQKNILETDHKDLVITLKYIGNCLGSIGKLTESLDKYKQALEIQKKASKQNPLQVAHLISNMGCCLLELGKVDEAISHCQRALEMKQRVLNPNHPRIADSLNNIAHCFYELDKIDEAITHYREALAIRQEVLNPNHPGIADSLYYIADCFYELGKIDEALTHYQEALKIRQKVLNPNHPKVADSLYNIGNCFYELGKIDEAITHYQEALAIRQEVLNPNPPRIAETLNNIGNCFYKLGKIDEAITHYQEALKIRQKVLNPNHPKVADSLCNIGNCFYKLGKIDEAITHYQEALKIRQKVLNPNHPKVADSLYNIANCFYELGKKEDGFTSRLQIDKAITHYQEALKIRQKVLNPNHLRIADSLNNIANCFLKKGDLYSKNKAYELQIQAFTIFKRTLGMNHEKVYSQVISIQENSLGPNHPKLAQSLFAFGVFLKGKNNDESLKLCTRALSIFENTPGYDCEVAKVNCGIGLALGDQGKYRLAEDKLLKAYLISIDIFGKEHETTKKYLKYVKMIKKSEENEIKVKEEEINLINAVRNRRKEHTESTKSP